MRPILTIILIILQYLGTATGTYIIYSIVDTRKSTFKDFDNDTGFRAIIGLGWPITLPIIGIGAAHGLIQYISDQIKEERDSFD